MTRETTDNHDLLLNVINPRERSWTLLRASLFNRKLFVMRCVMLKKSKLVLHYDKY